MQSDKATVEITSRYDGEIVKVHYLEGNIVKVAEKLVYQYSMLIRVVIEIGGFCTG